MQKTMPDVGELRCMRILLAEDLELNQYLVRHILEGKGIAVSVAGNGLEALELLRRESFDCVLMDIQMPVMDGIQAAYQIRMLEDPARASIPIIALTANVLAEDIERYKSAGMNDFLSKPFDEAGLLRVISRNQSVRPGPNDQGYMKNMPKLYDLSIVQSVSGGDTAFIRKMILLFIETVPQNLKELNAAVQSQHWEQVGKMAHKLKSTVDSMGIKSIHADIRSVEACAKEQKDLTGIPPRVEKITTTIESCIEQLMAEIA